MTNPKHINARFSVGVTTVLVVLLCSAASAAAPDTKPVAPVAVASSAKPAATPSSKPTITFSRDIEPILSANCFQCHGPDAKQRQAGLRLDQRPSATGKLASGKVAIVPGKPDEGELVRRIFSTDADVRMPPPDAHRQLASAQKETLKRWVAEGAQYSAHWSFVAPVRPPLPEVHNTHWSRNPIDRFILAQLETEGLKPSPEADKTTLIRRVTLDLTGLPPTPAEVDAFLLDNRPDAYEHLVDRLLESPHYGERMALEWLNAARFADTHGYHVDPGRDMWAWRNWVIDAFNRNQPFDQFTVEQLAGDLLPNPTVSQRIATGFNRNNMVNTEGGAIPEEYLAAYVVDRINTTSTVWMGLTMNCCQCHDHKFDPLTSHDFYSLFAMFHNIPEDGLDGGNGNAKPMLKIPSAEQQKQLDTFAAAVADLKRRQADRAREATASESTWQQQAAKKLAGTTVEPPGLVAHFTFDEMKGPTVADATGFLPPGIRRGKTTWEKGKVGGALKFDGNSNVELGNVLSIERDQHFSVGAWVRRTAKDDLAIISRIDDDSQLRGWEVFLRDGRVFARLCNQWDKNALRVNTLLQVPLDDWAHVLVTYDGSSKAAGVHIYIDGRPADVETTADKLTATIRTDKPARIGSRNPNAPFIGLISDVRFYNRDLSAADVLDLIVAGPAFKILAIPAAKRTPEQAAQLRQYFLTVIDEPYQRLVADLTAAEKKFSKLDRSLPTTMVMEESKPRETFMLMRGQYDKLGDKVTPGVPAALPPLPAGAPANRLGLARWLVSTEHPLTARVIVNRYWQMYFGTGIVKTSEDFGTQGERPTHRELLDWLACEFVGSGWNVRAMQRLIVTSAAYRQSSVVSPALAERDPENRLLARGPRVRLPAEMIRDLALSASGLLNAKIGGPSVLPYQTPGLWEEMAIDDAKGDLSAQRYVQSHGADLYRRTMYTFWKRTVPPASLYTFDAPDRETCTVRRPRTNTPLQALVLMNDPTYVEAARKLAERMMTDPAAATPAERIEFAFRLSLARKPEARELAVLGKLYETQLATYRADNAAALKLLKIGESPRNEKLDVAELAAWTVVANAILNLDETITKG